MSNILFDVNGQVDTPSFVLYTPSGKSFGQIPFIDTDSIEVVVNMNDASEISFDVYKTVDGELNPLWNKITDLKIVCYTELDMCFLIQVNLNEDENGTYKTVTGTSAGEAELGQILLRDVEINTEDDIDRDDYEESIIYNEENSNASILDRLLIKAPHYQVAHVDAEIASKHRHYSWDDKSIKDAFDEIAEDLGCLFIYNVSIHAGETQFTREISVYDLMHYCRDCEERFEEYHVNSDGVLSCPECGSTNIKEAYGEDIGIIIDKDSLADDIQYETDVDSVKNCFKLEGGDDYMTAAIRMCMPSNDGYIWYINDETKEDMSDDLKTALASYQEVADKYENTVEFKLSNFSTISLVSNKIGVKNGYSGTSYEENTVNGVIVKTDAVAKYNAANYYTHLWNNDEANGCIYICADVTPGEAYSLEYSIEAIDELDTPTFRTICIHVNDTPDADDDSGCGAMLCNVVKQPPATHQSIMFTAPDNCSGVIIYLYGNLSFSDLNLTTGVGGQYGNLVNKYSDYGSHEDSSDDVCPVIHNETAVGFSELVDEYFNAVTLKYYLQTSMMPTPEQEQFTAEAQWNNIKNGLTYLAINGLSTSTSKATVESAFKNAAKIYYASSQYNLTISNSSYTAPSSVSSDGYYYGSWSGTVTLTNEDDENSSEDVWTEDFGEIVITSSYYQYVQQQLEKMLSDADTDNYSTKALFKKDATEFNEALKLYSVDCLNEFAQICEKILGILIEQGCGTAPTITSATDTKTLQELMYDIYSSYDVKGKLIADALDNSSDGRVTEVAIVEDYIESVSAIIDEVHRQMNFKNYLSAYETQDGAIKNLYTEFAIYRREDTYKNDNYISDGLSDSEIIENARLFIKAANAEIYKSANLQHSISSTVQNFMLMDDFQGIMDSGKFKIGNWIRIIVDENVYRLRLLSYTIQFSDLQNIDIEFSDVTKMLGGGSDLKSIISQASSMATTYGAVTRQAQDASDKTKSFTQMLTNGLDLTNTKLVSSADHQEMVINDTGLTMKKYDPIIDSYVDEQMKITNTTIAYSDDDWSTVKTAFGKYYSSDGTPMYGLVGENIVGKIITGGNLSISGGGTIGDADTWSFVVNEDGVQLENSSLTLNCKNGNTIKLDYEDGIIIQTPDKTKTDGDGNTYTVEGDKVLWIDSDGNLQFRIASSGDTGTISSALTELQATLDGLSASVEETSVAVNDLDGSVSEVTSKVEEELTAQGLRISAIEKTTSDGVNSVTTETGYTFGIDGLRIEKGGSDVATLIDNNGMKIYTGDDEDNPMLTVDNEGVVAKNLNANTYLIIGKSRFENYGSAYTGCFWIG